MQCDIPNANPRPTLRAMWVLARMVRIDGRERYRSQQQGLVSSGHKIFGFVAATRHDSYKYDYS